MSSYYMDHNYGQCMHASAGTARELKYCNSLGVFKKTIIPLAHVDNSVLHTSLAISYPLVSKACSRNVYYM